MAKTTKTDANWATIDVTTLAPELAKAYATYKAGYQAMKAARLEFENAMSAAIEPPAGQRVIFGYNFGKLCVAIVDGEIAKPKAAASTLTLSEWAAQQRAANRNH